MQGIYHLKGTVKHYDWGGFSLLPGLLQLDNAEKKPFAEYWLGTHPDGPSVILKQGKDSVPLEKEAGPFSYLLKILDVREMLSIQVHPNEFGAREGWDRENKSGVSIQSKERNYRDPYHKPELMIALGDFWLLHGFKGIEETADILQNITELNEFLPVFHKSGHGGLYKLIMEMPQDEVNRILVPLIDQIVLRYNEQKLVRSTEDYWAAKAALQFSSRGGYDRGIFSIYLFNLLHLKKGEGIYQAPGIPHAYLEGQNVEIMASSDNVLRGGLTNKHVDVTQFLKHIKFEPTHPRILSGATGFDTPAKEFRLKQWWAKKGEELSLVVKKHTIVLLTSGSLLLESKDISLLLRPGHPSAIISAGTELKFRAEKDSLIFYASSL